MNKEIWKKIESIYDQVIEMNIKERVQFIKDHAGGDDVYQQVIKMLKSDTQFMEEYPGLVSNTDKLANHEPSSLGHFEIIKKIATGGMGRVYLAQSMNSDVTIHVALKTIRIELINKDLKQKFQNEKQILSRLKHKNIASLIDAGISDDNIPYIATEWVDGKSINDYCTDNELSLNVRLNLFKQICSAVSFAHNKLIIHRDIKPDNILVDTNGQVKLLDFGIAKIVDDNNNNKQTQTQIYTPDYASPEQINGELCTVATDVYSLGVVLFEILTNSKRFDLSGLIVSEKIKAICDPKAPDIKAINSKTNIDNALLNIINKAMHVDQSRRYQSVASLAVDIDNYINNRPVSAMKDSFLYKAKMFLLRNRIASFLSTLVLLAVITGLYINNQEVKLKLQEAKKSQAMLEFFQGILKTASPSQGGKTNLSVRKMFELGINKYNLDTINDPYVKAELAAQIGQIYGDLEIFDEMLNYTNIALKYYQENLIDDSKANSYMKLANRVTYTHMRRSEYDEAKNYLTKALSTVEEYNISPKNLSRSYNYFAEIYIDKDNKKSLEYLNQAESLARKNQLYEEIALTNYNKFSLFYDTNTDEQAIKYLDNAQLYFEKDKQTQFNPGLMQTLSARAELLSKMGKLMEAEIVYDQVNRLFVDTFGSPNIASISNRINNLTKIGDFQTAKKLLEATDEIFQQNGSEKNLDYYYLLYMKATTMIEFQEFKKAKAYLDETNDYYSKILPSDHKILSLLKMRYAELYLKSSNNIRIGLMKTELEEFLGKDVGKGLRRSALINLGNFNIYLGNLKRAEDYLSEAVSLLNLERGTQEYFYWQLQTALTFVKVKQGNIEDLLTFKKNKKQLLSKVSPNSWYDGFYSLD